MYGIDILLDWDVHPQRTHQLTFSQCDNSINQSNLSSVFQAISNDTEVMVGIELLPWSKYN
jgi:hypothetical protein